MNKITVGILAHVDAGKTTLAEAMLYTAGAVRRQGSVDNKDSLLDSNETERKRGITIFTGEATFDYGGTEIALLDTPGHIDFCAETERALSVLDCAVLVISSLDGVSSHTRTLAGLLSTYKIPTFIFVTKCDMERRGKDELLYELEKELGGVADFEDEEKTALCDEGLLEEYLARGTISQSSLFRAVRERKIFPCFFGSGLACQKVNELLSAICDYAALTECSYPADFKATVYKITHEKSERITKLKITGGTLRVKDTVNYLGVSEKVNEIRIYKGSKYSTVSEAAAGTVCSVTGLTKTFSGQLIGDGDATVCTYLEPVISYKIILPEGYDPRLALPKFRQLTEEDPKLKIEYSEQLCEFSCALMGKVQAEIFKATVKERFDLDIEIGKGSVIYKETLKNTVEGVGHYEPLRHYSEVHLLIEPLPRGSGNKFLSACSEDILAKNWQRLILTHLAEKKHLGVLTGSPLTDVKITLVSGKAHEKHTEGGDFRQSTYRAVRQGLMHAESLLLEPFYSLRLELPQALIGRAVNDIRLMGGSCEPIENKDGITLLTGKAPAAEINDYAATVASYSGGRGKLFLEFSGYENCHNAEKVISEIGYEAERDLENTPDSVFCERGAGFTVKWDKVPLYMHLESYFKKDKG